MQEHSLSEDTKIELELVSFLLDEPTWADTILVTINIIAPKIEYDYPRVETAEAPRFDTSSVTSETLQVTGEEAGAQFIAPVIMDCRSQWSKALPKIYGEGKDSKFTVEVNLNEAKQVLRYN